MSFCLKIAIFYFYYFFRSWSYSEILFKIFIFGVLNIILFNYYVLGGIKWILRIFRILISNRDSLSYPEKHMNIIFKFLFLRGFRLFFDCQYLCVDFYNDSSKFILDFALITFGIIFLIISDTYNEDICNKCGFGEYLNKMDKIISIVYIIYILLFIFIIVMMKLNYGR